MYADKQTKLIKALYSLDSGAVSSNKGIAIRCPFCGAQSGKGKEKFMLFVNQDGLYTGHNCFVCQERGGGVFGLKKIFDAYGQQKSIIELDDLVADNERPRAANKQPQSHVAELQWPPPWAKTDGAITKMAVEYLTSRQILEPETLLEKYGCIASHVILTSKGHTADYPCIIWPMRNIKNQIVGWSSRSIGAPPKGFDKSMTMPGADWKKSAVFGLDAINPKLPITIVEGFVSSLATPNSVATCGKAIATGQIELIASLDTRHIILALDPDVDPSFVRKIETSLIMSAPNAEIHVVPWDTIDTAVGIYGPKGGDPADRGARIMAKIIKKIIKKEPYND